MKILDQDQVVGTLRGDSGNKILWGNWTLRDSSWAKLKVQLESSSSSCRVR